MNTGELRLFGQYYFVRKEVVNDGKVPYRIGNGR